MVQKPHSEERAIKCTQREKERERRNEEDTAGIGREKERPIQNCSIGMNSNRYAWLRVLAIIELLLPSNQIRHNKLKITVRTKKETLMRNLCEFILNAII